MPGAPMTKERIFEVLRATHDEGTVLAGVRGQEATAIVTYWPWPLIEMWGAQVDGSWHGLFEPTRWTDIEPELVHAFCTEYVGLHARWPSIDTLRRLGGRTTNHRGPGDTEGQGALQL